VLRSSHRTYYTARPEIIYLFISPDREVCAGFQWGNLRERDHWGDPYVDGRIILRWIFGKWEGWRLDGVGSG